MLLTYDWRIRADKPLLGWFSPILRPLFAWNHRWAMRQGERSLRRELARRLRRPGQCRRPSVPISGMKTYFLSS